MDDLKARSHSSDLITYTRRTFPDLLNFVQLYLGQDSFALAACICNYFVQREAVKAKPPGSAPSLQYRDHPSKKHRELQHDIRMLQGERDHLQNENAKLKNERADLYKETQTLKEGTAILKAEAAKVADGDDTFWSQQYSLLHQEYNTACQGLGKVGLSSFKGCSLRRNLLPSKSG